MATALYDRVARHENGGICISLSPAFGLFEMGVELGLLP
jgi:hypothetical protein